MSAIELLGIGKPMDFDNIPHTNASLLLHITCRGRLCISVVTMEKRTTISKLARAAEEVRAGRTRTPDDILGLPRSLAATDCKCLQTCQAGKVFSCERTNVRKKTPDFGCQLRPKSCAVRGSYRRRSEEVRCRLRVNRCARRARCNDL